MKTLLILLTVILLPIDIGALCPFGCTCYDDTVCSYYCGGSQCQSSIPIGRSCSGHYVHPRECGSISYCDPTTWTCQFQKNYDTWCTYDYSCLSGYCDYSTRTCRYKNTFRWEISILIPILIVLSFVTSCIVLIVVRRRRLHAFASYHNRCVVLPASTPCSYQNACTVGEMPPPSYHGPMYTPSSKPYQG